MSETTPHPVTDNDAVPRLFDKKFNKEAVPGAREKHTYNWDDGVDGGIQHQRQRVFPQVTLQVLGMKYNPNEACILPLAGKDTTELCKPC